MELLRQKKRLTLAKRGHKLLKDKLDELIRRFMELVRDYQVLRREAEEALACAQRSFLIARAVTSREVLRESLLTPQDAVRLKVGTSSIMNIAVPKLEVELTGELYSYGFVDTASDMDTAFRLFAKSLPLMVKLAEREKVIELLAAEIEKTRRRVNALEYVLIPTLEGNIKQISMRLSEIERSNLTRLMKLKDIIRQH